MVEVLRRDIKEHHMMQLPITENQLEEMQMMEERSEHVGRNYPDTPDFRYVVQSVNKFFFPWEEAGSAENPIAKYEEGKFQIPFNCENK